MIYELFFHVFQEKMIYELFFGKQSDIQKQFDRTPCVPSGKNSYHAVTFQKL